MEAPNYIEIRFKVYNGNELIFTAVADLPDVAGPEVLAEILNSARDHFRRHYPSVDLNDPRIRQEWEKETRAGRF